MEPVKNAWDFFQNEILGMHWLNRIVEMLLNACGLDTTEGSAAVLSFLSMIPLK